MYQGNKPNKRRAVSPKLYKGSAPLSSLMGEKERVFGYIRRNALASINGPFEQNALYAAPSINYITLFLEEHPDFVEKLEQEQDRAIPELGIAVKKWLRNARRRKTNDKGVPDCVKELCSEVTDFDFMKRIELYT